MCATVPLRVRRVSRLASNRLRLDYTITNVGTEPSAVYWMAHPLFDATGLDAVDPTPPVDGFVRTASNVTDPDPRPLLLPHELPNGAYRKYRVDGGDAGTARALHATDGQRLTITWQATVPIHLQLWVDNGGIGPSPVVAPTRRSPPATIPPPPGSPERCRRSTPMESMAFTALLTVTGP